MTADVALELFLTPTLSTFHRGQGLLQLAHDPSGVLQRRVRGRLRHSAPDAPERGSGGRAEEAGHQLGAAEGGERVQVEERLVRAPKCALTVYLTVYLAGEESVFTGISNQFNLFLFFIFFGEGFQSLPGTSCKHHNDILIEQMFLWSRAPGHLRTKAQYSPSFWLGFGLPSAPRQKYRTLRPLKASLVLHSWLLTAR